MSDAQLAGHLVDEGGLLLLAVIHHLTDFLEILPHRLFEENGLGILGQQRHIMAIEGVALVVADFFAADRHPAAIGLVQSRQDAQGSGLAGAVAAQDAEGFPLRTLKR